MPDNVIDLSRPVYDLCSAYPELKDILAEAGLSEISKPGRLQTMGRVMTIPKRCEAKDIELQKVLSALRASGFTITGDSSKDKTGTSSSHKGGFDTETTTPEDRRKLLGQLLARLDNGESVEDVKADFQRSFTGVDAEEIADAEQELIKGGVPVEEVQKLCDVHTTLFEGSINSPVFAGATQDAPGHPVRVLRDENARILARVGVVRDDIARANALPDQQSSAQLAERLSKDADNLAGVSAHYKRKEELIFPHLEAHGIAGPSKVMWGKDDEVRRCIEMARSLAVVALRAPSASNIQSVAAQLSAASDAMQSMVAKEENVLIPLALKNLSATEWTQIAKESAEYGYSYIDEPVLWKADALSLAEDKLKEMEFAEAEGQTVQTTQRVKLSSGEFTAAQLEAVLNTIPLDLTFVDAQDKTRYFSHGDTRAFPRPMSCLGRDAYDCHPPKSQQMVHKVFDDFRSGARDSYEFWIHRHGKFLYIRYFAVRDVDGNYLGALETTQDIGHIRELEGENRRGADIRREAQADKNS